MSKRKIVILGGGMAGLAAAHELTRTPALRAQHDVTLLQMGWRLGGKAASGRDKWGRNLEHGLHVWFGCYNNTFGLVQDIYNNYPRPPDSPLQTWEDVAKPQAFTPLGMKLAEDEGWAFFPLTWPENDQQPGPDPDDAHAVPAHPWQGLMQALRQAVSTLTGRLPPEVLSRMTQDISAHPDVAALGPVLHQAHAHSLLRRPEGFTSLASSDAAQLGLHELLDMLYHLADTVHDGAHALRGFLEPRFILLLCEAAQALDQHFLQPLYDDLIAKQAWQADAQILLELVNISLAAVHGYFKDLYIPNRPYEALDELDMRDWLHSHGASDRVLAHSTIMRVVYDTLFQYIDGDVAQPSYAAGTGLGVLARLIGTFKGSVMWDIQAGMGEAMVAPLYESLKDRVNFKFFHKVDKLALSEDGQRIARIHITRQADTLSGPYEPLTTISLRNEKDQKIKAWPAQALYEQLVGGDAMRTQKVNFESHWYDWPAARHEVMEEGKDFDLVVLAICMGAYKPLNDEPGMCDELLAQNGPFASFVQNIGIVPSQSLQLWSTRSLEQLGWTQGKPALVSGPEYLNIWADMSQVLAFEPCTVRYEVQSLHYLCGTFKTELYKAPSSAKDTPALALDALRKQTLDWLNTDSRYQWPKAQLPGGGFDFNVLACFDAGDGPPPLSSQYLRANIDPTECCVLSSAGTTRYRLHPLESGFGNLVLAGEATRHGFNTTTFEGAVMSGRAASRAICGSPSRIDYYDFLSTPVASWPNNFNEVSP